MTPLRALILDFGGVLARHQPSELVQRMASIAGAPVGAFTDAYWAHRNEYDLRGDPRRYWDRVLRDAAGLDGAAREALRPGLIAVDQESWAQYREELWELTTRFRAAGGRTAMLSNCGPEVFARVRADRDLARTFDATVISWEVGFLKPDPAIYRLTLERLDVPAPAALFVDDRPENVTAAEALGMQVLHFAGDESVAELRARAARVG